MLLVLLREAVQTLRYQRRRTILTMFGMAWGIATVVLLLGYGAGLQVAIENIFQSFGAKVISITPGRTSLQAGGTKAGTKIQLVIDDIDLLRHSVPLIGHITPEVKKQVNAQANGRSYQLPLQGDYEAIMSIHALQIHIGRFFTDDEVARHAHVMVLTSEAKTKLFSNLSAIGETVRANGIPYTVIGVLNPKMQLADGDNVNRVLYVPFTSVADLRDIQYLDAIWLNYSAADYTRVERMVRNNLAAVHNFNPSDLRAIWVYNSMKKYTQFEIITFSLQVFLLFIGMLTLGIGGVGLMNIMLASVMQRTREIGMQKAVGARKSHILVQFLAEAMAITLLGGLVGIGLAYGVAHSVGSIALYSAIAKNAEAGDVRLTISSQTLLLATCILVFIGLVSGMFPAVRAANMDPIEALRYE